MQVWRTARRRLRRRWRRLWRRLRSRAGLTQSPPALAPLSRAQRRRNRQQNRSGFAWALRIRSERHTVATLSTNDPTSALELLAEALHGQNDIRPGWSISLEHLPSGRSLPLERAQVASWRLPLTIEQIAPFLAQLDDDLAANLDGYASSSSTIQTVGPQRTFVDIEQAIHQALVSHS